MRVGKLKMRDQSERGDETSGQSGSVQSVDRALTILELLAEYPCGLRLKDLAERAGLAPSTAHRLLTTMSEKRFVQFDRLSNSWRVGRQSFTVGAAFIRQFSYVSQAMPALKHLRDRTRETVSLAVADGDQVIVIAQLESRVSTRSVGRPGQRAALAATALGKAILAHYCDDDILSVARSILDQDASGTPLERVRTLLQELHEIRLRGWALHDEKFVAGLRCAASAIYNEHAEPLAAISASGPSIRISSDDLTTLGAAVASMAQQITNEIGGKLPRNREC